MHQLCHARSGLWALPALCLFLAVSACQTTNAGHHVYRLRIERGDTLAEIARKYDTTPQRIMTLNHLAPGTPPAVGAIIRVEPGPAGLVASDRAAKHPKRDEDEEPDTQGGRASHGLLFGGDSSPASLDWPLSGSISSYYGQRHGRFHHGIDIRAKTGSAVLAAAPGVVEFAGWQHGYGKVVILRHKRLKSVYAHLAKVKVAVGAKIGRAAELGMSGQSGNSTGPHLHFEIRTLKDESVDPLPLMELPTAKTLSLSTATTLRR